MAWPKQIGLLFLLTALIGTVGQVALPHRISWRGDWDRVVETKTIQAGLALANVDDAQKIVDAQSHIILDARANADYEAGHLPGALSLPQAEKDTYLNQVLPLLTPEQPIMTYCSGEECDESFELSVFLKEQGFTNIILFAGGITEWQKAGLPTEGDR